MPHIRRVLLLLALTCLFGATLAAPASAQDVEPLQLELKSVQDLLWVEDTQRLFITGGSTATANNRLLVLDGAGNVIKEQTTITGVRDMTYEDVNKWVWVARTGPSDKRVSAYDATTGVFKKTVTLTGSGMCPATLTVTFEKLVVGSSCGQEIRVVELTDLNAAPETHTGVDATIRMAAPEPRPDLTRVAALGPNVATLIPDMTDDQPLDDIRTQPVTPTVFDLDVDREARSVAIAGNDISIFKLPEFTGSPVVKSTAGTVYAVDYNIDGTVVALQDVAPHLVAFKQGAAFTTPFWTFNLGPDVTPIANALEVADDGRVFVLLDTGDGVGVVVPPPPGGGGGGGPVVTDKTGSISGNVTFVGDPVGPGPTSVRVDLYDPFGLLQESETLPANGGGYKFDGVTVGTYHVGFAALNSGLPAGYFSELYKDVGFLQHDVASPVAVAADKNTAAVDGTLLPFYTDILNSVFLYDIVWMADTAITKGCNPPENTRYCPDDTVTRGQMAAFLARAFGYTELAPPFTDTAGSIFEADIRKLAKAGVTLGCNPPANDKFCPDDTVTRGQMAAFLVRAFDLAPAPSGQFVDIGGSVFAGDIDSLAVVGVTKGCNPPTNDRFCPDDPVTRGQMAAFLKRAFELAG